MKLDPKRTRLVTLAILLALTSLALFAVRPAASKQADNTQDTQQRDLTNAPLVKAARPVSEVDLNADGEQLKSARLVAADLGWVVTDTHLLITTTAGKHWKDITPAVSHAKTLSAFFINRQKGWVVLSIAGRDNLASLVVASTTNGGESWTMVEPLAASSDYKKYELSDKVQVQFIDSSHGWLMAKLATSSNFSLGLILESFDGGRSWQKLPDPPIGDSLRFSTDKLGWLAGGADGSKLFRTTDGGSSWSEVILKAPDNLGESLQTSADLPTFLTTDEAILPITFSSSDRTTVVFYSSKDGGESWHIKRLVESGGFISAGNKVATAIIAPDLFAVASLNELNVNLVFRGKPTKKAALDLKPGANILAVDFVDATSGWILENEGECTDFKTQCSQTTALFITHDGAITMTEITPHLASRVTSDVVKDKNDILAPDTASGTHTSHNHKGFDKCAVDTVGNMQTWWTNSPYFDANVYLGGVNRSCSQANLNSAWVSQVSAQGWGLIPTWVGPQATCTTCTTCSVMSSNSSTAQAQGISEANSAADAASALGLTQTIIYYDMERYNPTTSCQTAVRSFINGWVQQMHARGNLAGVYGSPQNAQDDWASISNVPDAVWIAKWDDSISVFGLTPLSDSLWVNNQRIHQYHGGHNETYGSVTFNIDNDYEDGPVAGSNGTQSQPNLVPYQISGWSDKIVVSTLTGTNTDSSSYRTNDTLYVDWAEANIGTAATVPTFYSDLYVDGVFRQTWQTNFSLAPGAAANVLDYSIGSLSAGQHTIKIIIDTTNTISESSESDNEYTKIIAVTSSNTGTWTQLSSSPPAAITNCLLLTDGRVMCQQAGGNRWYALTPTSSGSYVNGTWSTLASMQSGYSPLYFASAVLPDGRVIIEGGEYNCSSFPNCGSPVQLSQGAIYNPSANSWTAVSPPSGWSTIGDAMGIVLADGSYFLSDSQSTKTAKFNASSLTWSAFGSGFQASTNNEAGWTLLPDNSLLTVDAHPANSRLSERFNAVTGVWSGAGNTPVSLADNDSTRAGASYEIGPGVLRPNGTVFYVGANPNIGTPCCTGSAHTAIFNTASNSWSAGPNIPNSDAANDAPAAVLPNSNVLMQLSPPFSDTVFGSPSRFYEFDGLTIFQVNSPALTNYSSFQGGMLVLPTGQVLFTHQTTDAYIYTSNGSPSASWAPTITNVSSTLSPGSTYTISGTQFNGLTQGAYYGDDLQAATNYPLVRITNNATGHIFYARTHGHSSMGVATGSSSVSTSFDVPAGIELGASMLVVVANGIPSASVNVNISNTALQVTVQTSPSGRTFTVDGTNYSSAQTFSWSSGSSHTIGTTSTQSGATGTQYTWSNWSDGGAISHSASPSSNTTYTANFTTQYFLTMNAGAGGSVSPSSNWFNSGQSVSISASPNSGFSFNGWTGSGSGSFTGSSNPASATMNGPITETATFASANVQVTVQTSPSGLAYTVDGNTFTGAQPFTWTSGSSHTISTTTPQSVIAGTQYLWSNWSDGGGISHSVSPTSNTTYTANFAQQHFLTMNASAGGTASPPSGWFNSGQTVSISANPNSGFGFDGWTGSGLGSFTGSTNPSSVAINGPVTETANFSLTPVGTNFAKAVNGGVASASSTTPNSQFPGYNFLPSVTVDGDRRGGLNFWRDDTASVYPDWLQVDFNGSKSITEVDVFTVQDNDQNTMEPTQAMTFSLNGITAFDVQYWTGSAWITVPNGSVTGNNKVWRQFTFSPIATSKIRVLVNNALNTRSRIVELEAWGTSSNGTNQALAANGGVASASSTTPNSQFPGYNFLPAVTIDGDRRGGMNFWRDDTANTYPDWLQVDFNGSKNITEVDVITVQDDDQNSLEPTQAMTFSLSGITAFDVQYWTGSAWITVPNGSVTGNNKVWRQFTFSPIATSKIRVLVNNALNTRSRIVELEAWGTSSNGINQALAANGGVASASSTTPNSQFPGYNFLPAVTIDGDRRGGMNFWRDDTANTYPDWLQVDFNGSKNITEVDVITVQDDDQNSLEPTQAMTFSLSGITAFDVQYWTGSAWITVPNGSVTGNNKVWRQFTFSPIATSKIRVLVNNALNTRSRIVELEAWGTSSNGTNQALAANGGVASASSTTPNSQFPGYNFVPAVTIDGDRRGGMNFWRDDTANTYPDWLQVDFNGSKNITEVDVITVQDDDQNSLEPTQAMTFSLSGITAFDVQYWTGSAWITVPNGSVTGNNKVWRQFTFSPIATSKIRVLVNNALNTRSRIVELEAY